MGKPGAAGNDKDAAYRPAGNAEFGAPLVSSGSLPSNATNTLDEIRKDSSEFILERDGVGVRNSLF